MIFYNFLYWKYNHLVMQLGISESNRGVEEIRRQLVLAG